MRHSRERDFPGTPLQSGLLRAAPLTEWVARWEHTGQHLSATGHRRDSTAYVLCALKDVASLLGSPLLAADGKNLGAPAQILASQRGPEEVRHGRSFTSGGPGKKFSRRQPANLQLGAEGLAIHGFVLQSRVADTVALLENRLRSVEEFGTPHVVHVAEQMLSQFRSAAKAAFVRDPLVPVARFSEETGISKSTIRRLIESGDLPALRLRKRYLVIRCAA